MRSERVIHVVTAHAEGETGAVIVGGVAPPPGATLWEMRERLAADGELRALMMNEPRGHMCRHVNLLVPPRTPGADAGFIIMEPEDMPPMSGSNSMCVATVLLETGILPMREPETGLVLEAPGGLVRVRARCRDGRVERLSVANLPSFADRLDVPLEVEGLGTLRVDTAFGGDSFVIVEAAALGFDLVPDEAADLAALGGRIVAAANAQIGFIHPELEGWRHISFCNFVGPLVPGPEGPETRAAVAIRPGRLDRSPCGTGVSARLAVLAARGRIEVGERLVTRSLIGGRFEGRILGRTTVGDRPAILPEISGRAWITGMEQILRDPADPWPRGWRLPDAWGTGRAAGPGAGETGEAG